jgi:excisionase family DNA binding protein
VQTVSQTDSLDDARPLLTCNELARELGLSKSHVFELAAEHRIPSYRFGRSLRFRLDEVLAASRAGASA